MIYVTLLALAAFAVHIWLTFVFFGSVCALQRARDAGNMPPIMKIFGYPVLAVGLVLDAVLHLVWGTLLFLDLPRKGEWLLTQRLIRYKRLNDRKSLRYLVAMVLCVGLLDPLDPKGCHCRTD